MREVREWLVDSGIARNRILPSDNRGWFILNIPAWQAEELFRTKYHEYVHSRSEKLKIGSDEYIRHWQPNDFLFDFF